MPRSSAVLRCLMAGLLAAAGCGDSAPWAGESTSRHPAAVVGGEPASEGDFPSTVALTDPNGEPFCTGTLVSTTTVVTAAHCVEAMPLSKTRVVYGYLHPEAAPPAARLAVSKSTAHPKYNPGASLDTDGLGQVNDIGVVVLAEPLTAARYTPILPPERVEEILYPFRDIYLAGYGVYQMPYKMGDLFKAVTPHIRHIEWEMLAGKPGNPDTCNGDSGGPAYVAIGCELWLVGVTSRAWAKSVKPCGDGGIYALASSYLSFIEGVSGGPLPAGEGTGGGLPNVVCEDGGLDAGWDVLPDVDGKCFPATSVCDPLTNFGCDEAAGQVCGLGDYGMPGCKPGPHVAGPGQSCDDSGRSCIAGYYCGKSLRCEKLCCGDGDCGEGAACTRLDTVSGTLGTCPPVSGKDAAAEQADAQEAAAEAASEAGSEGGIEAEAGAAAQGVGATDDGGCSCRSGPGSSKGGWALVLLACAALARRRATCRPPAP